MQRVFFPRELELLNKGKPAKTSECRNFNLFYDLGGIVICESRVQFNINGQKCLAPILVNTKHVFTKAYIRYLHVSDNCASRTKVCNRIRQLMHGHNMRRSVLELITGCHHCRRFRAIPYGYPSQPPRLWKESQLDCHSAVQG